jgi:hypothetical protein
MAIVGDTGVSGQQFPAMLEDDWWSECQLTAY